MRAQSAAWLASLVPADACVVCVKLFCSDSMSAVNSLWRRSHTPHVSDQCAAQQSAGAATADPVCAHQYAMFHRIKIGLVDGDCVYAPHTSIGTSAMTIMDVSHA